jgi:hypothetical protein
LEQGSVTATYTFTTQLQKNLNMTVAREVAKLKGYLLSIGSLASTCEEEGRERERERRRK